MNKVLGPVEGSDLGFTLSHEHVLLGAAGMVNPDVGRHLALMARDK